MYHSYRGRTHRRRRHTHRGVFALLLLLIAVFLVSCVAGSNPLWIRGLFGVDAANYAAEPTERELDADSEVSDTLCDMVEILISHGVELQPFGSATRAVKLYRDCILNDMLRDHYTDYTGNADALAELNDVYPHHSLLVLIPEYDFEVAVYSIESVGVNCCFIRDVSSLQVRTILERIGFQFLGSWLDDYGFYLCMVFQDVFTQSCIIFELDGRGRSGHVISK